MKIININMLGFIIDWMNETGEKIALVGETGVGKTTISKLIPRFYDVDEGEILVDGINVKDYNLDNLRKMLVTFGFAILIVIGAICVARKALKTVVGIACLFVIVLIVWLIISR